MYCVVDPYAVGRYLIPFWLFVCKAQDIAPVIIPAHPKPYFSWDFIPTAFHGANRTGVYTDDAIVKLARHQMVYCTQTYPMFPYCKHTYSSYPLFATNSSIANTPINAVFFHLAKQVTIEKWYTPCASQGPIQGDPSCAVENKIETLLGRIKALNPNITGILYLNSMFDFAFYQLHGEMMKAEAAGQQSFLRDKTGTIIELCNDGNGYCNITTFDWTKPHVRDLWFEAITNATAIGAVDGIFADHSAQENIQIGAKTNGQRENQLCNGKGDGRSCYNFTSDFAKSFNSWHLWATNKSQDLLSKTTGGPVICGWVDRHRHTMTPYEFWSCGEFILIWTGLCVCPVISSVHYVLHVHSPDHTQGTAGLLVTSTAYARRTLMGLTLWRSAMHRTTAMPATQTWTASLRSSPLPNRTPT